MIFTQSLSETRQYFALLLCIPTTTLIFILQFQNTGRGLLVRKKKIHLFKTIDLSILAKFWPPRDPREALNSFSIPQSRDKYFRLCIPIGVSRRVQCHLPIDGLGSCSRRGTWREDLVLPSSAFPLGSLLSVSLPRIHPQPQVSSISSLHDTSTSLLLIPFQLPPT